MTPVLSLLTGVLISPPIPRTARFPYPALLQIRRVPAQVDSIVIRIWYTVHDLSQIYFQALTYHEPGAKNFVIVRSLRSR